MLPKVGVQASQHICLVMKTSSDRVEPGDEVTGIANQDSTPFKLYACLYYYPATLPHLNARVP
jgi:hypothetical protein